MKALSVSELHHPAMISLFSLGCVCLSLASFSFYTSMLPSYRQKYGVAISKHKMKR